MDIAGLDGMGILLRLGLGVVVGFSIGLTGVGGGVLGLQAMTLALKMDPVRAVGTTSLYIFLTNISASFQHAKLKNIAWKAVVRLLAGAIPANILIASWISRQGNNTEFKAGLKNFIICVVFFSVGVMIINAVKKLRSKVEAEERVAAAIIRDHGGASAILSVLIGALVGGLIGATSVGGGVLIVPMFIILFGLSASRTVGSSIFMAMVLTCVTALVYGKGGEVDFYSATVMAVGSLIGTRFGSKLSIALPDTLLRWIMIAVILMAAIMMVVNR